MFFQLSFFATALFARLALSDFTAANIVVAIVGLHDVKESKNLSFL